MQKQILKMACLRKVFLAISVSILWVGAVVAGEGGNDSLLKLGEKPPQFVLDGQAGEMLNGGGWNSSAIGGKVTLVMYVDPDHVGDNAHVEEKMQSTFTKDDVKVFGVVDAESTWIPNFMLRRRLSSKQANNPLLSIVLDYNRLGEKVWGLKDDRYNVMAFDKDGRLFFIKEGALSNSDLETLINGIKIKISGG